MKKTLDLVVRADAIIYEVGRKGKRPISIDSTKLYNNIRDIAGDVVDLIQSSIGKTGFDRIAPAVERAIPTASAVAWVMEKPLIFIQRDKLSLVGLMVPGNVVLPIDDIIGSDDKPTTVVNSIVASGGLVRDYVCLLDEDRAGSAALRNMGIRTHSLLHLSDLPTVT